MTIVRMRRAALAALTLVAVATPAHAVVRTPHDVGGIQSTDCTVVFDGNDWCTFVYDGESVATDAQAYGGCVSLRVQTLSGKTYGGPYWSRCGGFLVAAGEYHGDFSVPVREGTVLRCRVISDGTGVAACG
ncbi:MAG TPA: hypothetical protein VM618_09165 [Acidimicrobiia bacterium]|nr:hypothetical protein [Acidimicrobiia bacterium]